MKKKTAAKVVKSTAFKRIFLLLGILFIILTYFISVTPDSFLVYGYYGVFFYNLFASSVLIMPVLVERMDLFGVVFVSALGNVPNTSINYLVGSTSKRFFISNPLVLLLKKWMERYGLIMVYLIAIIPLPIDVNGLMAGYIGIPFRHYLLANFLGRTTSFLLAGLGVWTFTALID